MNSLANYIENGQGRGLKRFLLFTLLLGALFGVFLGMIIYKTADLKVQDFFKQVPQVEIKGGKIVAPENAYIAIPFLDEDEGGFVLDTTGAAPKMVFQNGIYVTTDKVYVKNGVQLNMAGLSDVPDSVLTLKDVKSFVGKSVAMIAGALGFGLLIVLWIGYALLYLAIKLFFLIIARTTCPYVRGRSVFVAWSSIIMLDILLVIFGYGYSLPIAFVLALLLAILIVFKTPLHSMEMEETLVAVTKMPVTPDEKNSVSTSKTVKKASVKAKVSVKKPVVKPAAKPVVKPVKKAAKTAPKKKVVKK